MANTIITSKMTQILSLEMAKNAGFLKIGSKDYFSDQINGKMRAGKTYSFVLPDAGQIGSDLEVDPRDIVEKNVDLTIQVKNNSVKTDALEGVTDIKWDEEIAKSYAAKLMNAVVKEAVEQAVLNATSAFVGSGFQPLAKAGAHLQSIVSENIYGFCDTQMQAVLAANGQQFVPNGAPGDLYAKGKLGTFQGVDYKAERFIKPITISSSEVSGMASKTAVSYTPSTGVLVLSDAVSLKAGTPIFLEDVFAADMVGDATSVPFAFIVAEDVDSSANVKVQKNLISDDIGSRSFVGTIASAAASIPEAGTYYRAILRADGAFCYSPVNTLDFKLTETTTSGETDGLKVFCNQFTDGKSAENLTRWDMAYLQGTVEPRACAIAYVKQA